MLYPKVSSGVFAAAFVAIVIAGVGSRAAEMQTPQSSTSNSNGSTQTKIVRALSAAPPEVAKAATVVEMDGQGKMTVLRAGTDGFTCMPGDPTAAAQPAM